MLDSHPEMAIPPESYFVTELEREWRTLEPFQWQPFLQALSVHDRFVRWGLPIAALQNTLEESAPATYAEAIRRTFECYASAKRKKRYGDKTPRYVQKIGLLAELFPEALFIHVIRDGRDVALSFLEREWGPATVEEAAQRWVERVASGRAAGANLAPGRYLEVRYESFVEDPQSELDRLCSVLDLSPAPAMLRYFERADEVVAGTKYPDQFTGLSLPPTPGLRDWRKTMPSGDVVTFESIAGGLLAELGYERGLAD